MRVRVGLVAAAAIVAVATVMSIRTLAQPPGSPHETVKATVAGADISIRVRAAVHARPQDHGRARAVRPGLAHRRRCRDDDDDE